MEIESALWWVLFIVGTVWFTFLIAFLVTVYRAAREALIFFRRANAAVEPEPVRGPINPADTVWDDIR